MMAYDFGPSHPLKSFRLDRTIKLLQAVVPSVVILDPGTGDEADLLRVHSRTYVDMVQALSYGERPNPDQVFAAGFGADTPPFKGIYQSALSYVAGAVQAASSVNEGAPLAFNIGGGLHHAQRDKASGFCVFNDPAIACQVLREKHERVAYIDIDLHHGDGVQWIFYDDPSVLTYSIHETGRTLYPGTGFVRESGAGNTKINVPMEPGTTGDTWLRSFNETLIPAIEAFRPGAIVLQMGCDPHFNDPLGHLKVSAQEWLGAVETVGHLGIPIVACGGGGYAMQNVPRMWVSAILKLSGIEHPDKIPDLVPSEWGMTTFSDPVLPEPRNANRQEAEQVVEQVQALIRSMRVPGTGGGR